MFRGMKAPTWAPIRLRLMVGFGFLTQQQVMVKILKLAVAFASILRALGVSAPHLMAWLTILTGPLGGLSVLPRRLVPLISVPMAGVLLVAMFSVH